MVQRIYTRTGDDGETGLFGGGRVLKSDSRVCAYGEVDELNAVLGSVIAAVKYEEVVQRLLLVQSDLFIVGAHLATSARDGRRSPQLPELPSARVAQLEQWIDQAEAELPELRTFVLPGGSPAGAALHIARTVCRRAERTLVHLAQQEDLEPAILIYMNRLSDFLFDMARLVNQRDSATETPWTP